MFIEIYTDTISLRNLYSADNSPQPFRKLADPRTETMAAKKAKPAKKPNPGFQFIIATLKKNPKATYKDISAAAAKKKMKVFPIMFGRAQAMLGIVKQAPRGAGKASKAKVRNAAPAVAKRGPGRPRKNPAPSMDGSLDSIVAAVKSSEQAKARYRGALEKIQAILADALAD